MISVNARVSSRNSVTSLNDEVQVVVPDVMLEGGESVKAGEPNLRGGLEEASSKVAEVMESLSPRSMRNSFAGMWARTLRVKITGRDGTVKLDVSIPVSSHEVCEALVRLEAVVQKYILRTWSGADQLYGKLKVA